MRLLHLGSGFRPWRRGGLVAYVEDLVEAQVDRGHDVAYLYSGRQYPFVPGPRLRRRQRRGVEMLEIVNSPLYDHGRQPALELDEPRVEAIVEQVVRDFRPDVLHVHEIAGLPSSVFAIAERLEVPTIFTLQDYFALCPMFKLLDAAGRVCLRTEVGADCVATAASEPRSPGVMFEATLRHDAWKLPMYSRVPGAERIVGHAARGLAGIAARRADAGPADAAAFQRRREVNVERLSRVDLLVAMSHRVAEIHQTLGVDADRLRTIQLTLKHIEHLRPRAASGTGPVTFATLAGLESAPKGGHLLLEAVRKLTRVAPPGSFRLAVFGYVAPEFAEQAAGLEAVEIRSAFRPDELDVILDEVDVGLMPSIWEEAYGYAGVEFLAKGIPVVGNAIGGIVDYVREGETGWLNVSCSAGELARIMLDIIERPAQIAALNERLVAERDKIIKPMARHADEMDALYAEVVGGRASAAR